MRSVDDWTPSNLDGREGTAVLWKKTRGAVADTIDTKRSRW
jgi:hypothetical protein